VAPAISIVITNGALANSFSCRCADRGVYPRLVRRMIPRQSLVWLFVRATRRQGRLRRHHVRRSDRAPIGVEIGRGVAAV